MLRSRPPVRPWHVAVPLALVIAAGGVVAANSGADPSDRRPATVAAAVQPAATVAAEPAFSILERSAQRPPSRVARMIEVLERRLPGLQPDRARGARATDGTQAWVVPGREHTCLGADNGDGTGYGCATNAEAARGRLGSVSVDRDGNARGVFLVPDGVTHLTAGERTANAQGNVVAIRFREGDALALTWRDGSRTPVESD